MGGRPGLATAGTTARGPLHPLWAAAPVTRRDTRSEGVHCLRIGCSAPNHKSNRGNCETRAWLRCLWAAAGPVGGGGAWPDNESTRPPQAHFAHNFPRSLLEIARKRCNPNDMNSMFEVLAGELRAKLMGEQTVRQRAEQSSRRGRLAGRRPRARQAARPDKQREAARPHQDQAARTSGDSCQKSPISQHSTSRRRGRPRR